MDDVRPRGGDIVIGVMLVVIGVAVALERAGVIAWADRWTLWPVVLIGIGLARFVQTPAGRPRQGLILMLGGVWLAAGDAGWLTLADSWPLLVIVLGLVVALNPGRRLRFPPPPVPGNPAAPSEGQTRRHDGSLTPLAVMGIWIALFVAVQVSGLRGPSLSADGSNGATHVVSVMGRSQRAPSGPFSDADVTTVMGRSELDLRAVTIPTGAEATVDVFSAMGAVVVRVPADWTIDTRALAAFGNIEDERFTVFAEQAEAPAGPPPRLVLRGLVLMGKLVIVS